MSQPDPADPLTAPLPADAPSFSAPWQAQAFAMTVALQRAGLFAWPEWAAVLSRELQGGAVDGSDYHDRWLAALERMLHARGLAPADEVAALAESWQRAAHATPHGRPIRLENDPGN
ncbi:MAG: nitrile hydratase accessory protein [Alkalilacustris sp.]